MTQLRAKKNGTKNDLVLPFGSFGCQRDHTRAQPVLTWFPEQYFDGPDIYTGHMSFLITLGGISGPF
jgi:hypothetical protein